MVIELLLCGLKVPSESKAASIQDTDDSNGSAAGPLQGHNAPKVEQFSPPQDLKGHGSAHGGGRRLAGGIPLASQQARAIVVDDFVSANSLNGNSAQDDIGPQLGTTQVIELGEGMLCLRKDTEAAQPLRWLSLHMQALKEQNDSVQKAQGGDFL